MTFNFYDSGKKITNFYCMIRNICKLFAIFSPILEFSPFIKFFTIMRKAFPLFVSLLLLIHVNLSAQKVAVCGFNSVGTDGFSFVALVPLGPTDIIYFTDGPYVAASNSFNLTATTTDGVLQYTPPAGGVTVGDVIVVVETATANTSVPAVQAERPPVPSSL